MADAKKKKLPVERSGITHHFIIGANDGYVTVNCYKNGKVAEVFVKMSKIGTTISGLLDSWAITLSIGLQHGVPLRDYVEKLKYVRFDPQGPSGPELGIVSSVVDYLVRWLELRYLSGGSGHLQSLSSTKLPENSR
jgi:ribonucleoside-diphosphate reductase alpha chain